MRETIGYKPKVANWIQEQIKHGKVYLISWSILLEDAAFAKPSGRLESFGWGSLDHLPLLEPGKGNYVFFPWSLCHTGDFTKKNPKYIYRIIQQTLYDQMSVSRTVLLVLIVDTTAPIFKACNKLKLLFLKDDTKL